MEMAGSQRIAASREAVYAALNDPDVLRRCIPGCESVEKLSDTEMTAKATLKIGPVKASFSGKVTLSDLDPPSGYTITGEGSGGAAGFASGTARVRLEPDGDATVLHYSVQSRVGGKLAQIGARLIDATAKKLADEFFAKFGAVMAPAVPAGTDTPAEASEPGTEKTGGWFGRVLGRSNA